MASYKVEEVDGPTTYYDSSGKVFKFDETGNSLVPFSGKSNSLVPSSGKSNSLIPPTNQVNKAATAATVLGIIGAIANTENPFSETGETFGQTAVRKTKDAGKYIADKAAEKFKNWWNKPKEPKLIEGPKGGGAKKTTKRQTQIVPRNNQTKEQTQIVPRTIKTKQVTELGTVSSMVKRDQIQQAAQRLIEQAPQEDPLYAYEKESIRNIEAAQRKRVPWRLPPIDVGMTRMTGFEPFSSTADQTFNIFYGSGSIDPFIRS